MKLDNTLRDQESKSSRAQNSWHFIDELVEGGKQFDMMFYPMRKHGISDRPARSPKDAQYFLKWIDRVLELLEASDAFDTPAQKREVLGVWREARSVYAGLAAE